MRASELAKELIDRIVLYDDPEVVVSEQHGSDHRPIHELRLDRSQAKPTSPVKYKVVL